MTPALVLETVHKPVRQSDTNLELELILSWHKRQKPMLSAAGLSGRACVKRMRSGENKGGTGQAHKCEALE
jgi:hypothetical protein